LVRTIRIFDEWWGVHVIVRDKTDNDHKIIFSSRKFRFTKKYPSIKDNITRAMIYYHAPQNQIEVMQKCYEQNKQ
jgi:hypothetical protein